MILYWERLDNIILIQILLQSDLINICITALNQGIAAAAGLHKGCNILYMASNKTARHASGHEYRYFGDSAQMYLCLTAAVLADSEFVGWVSALVFLQHSPSTL